jgi:hypothetical protein
VYRSLSNAQVQWRLRLASSEAVVLGQELKFLFDIYEKINTEIQKL